MKIHLLSDIHGNWPALQAVLSAEPDADQILCLGDLVNYGPQPAECVAWAMNTLTTDRLIQGNHDRAVGLDENPQCSPAYPQGRSPYGILQMAGNVDEWCADWYQWDVYRRYAKGDLRPPPVGETRAVRSGTCVGWQKIGFRCAHRRGKDPALVNILYTGIRCACDAPLRAEAAGATSCVWAWKC